MSLKIVEKARLRACTTSSRQNDTVSAPSTNEAAAEEEEAVEKVKKKKVKKKKSKKVEVHDFTVDLDDKGVEKGDELKSIEIGQVVEEKVDVTDNIVLRKLLRGPRYFDPPDCGWGAACYNCGEEGHTTVSCTSAKRKRPCFVCGSLEHNGKDCYICKKGGHRAKDCPEKGLAGGSQSSKICLKCGHSEHEMFSCKNEYSSDDLKEIQCYICKNFGHLCCVNYPNTVGGELSCYRCGLSGHTGLACTRLRRESNGAGTPSSCYKCKEEGHFARECTSSAKVPKRHHESTPKQNRSEQDENFHEGRFMSRDPNTMGRGEDRYEGGFRTPSKSKLSFGSVAQDTGEFPHRKLKMYGRKSPVTPTSYHSKFYHSSAGGSNSYGRGQSKFSNSTAGGSDYYGQAREFHSNDYKIKKPKISSWGFNNSKGGGMP